MKKIKEQNLYIPYNLCLKMKDLGFDWATFDCYWERVKGTGGFGTKHEKIPKILYDQAFAWFRENGLVGIVSTKRINNNGGFEYCALIDDMRLGGKIHYMDSTPSYESSQLNVLNRLIEMCKSDDKTFEFTGETMLHGKVVLNRIRAIVDIPERGVKKGDIGGWIEKEDNLFGNAWVYDESKIYGDSKVYDNAEIREGSEVRDEAKVYGESCIRNKSKIRDHASVFDNAIVNNKSEVKYCGRVYGNAIITDESMVGDYAHVHGDAFIEKSSVYGNASVLGKVIVRGSSAIYDRAEVSGRVEVNGRSSVYGNVIISGEIKISDESKIR